MNIPGTIFSKPVLVVAELPASATETPAPIFDPVIPISGPTQITISVPERPEAVIHYTYLGVTQLYTGPVTIEPGNALEATAIVPGLDRSQVTYEFYAHTALDSPVITPSSGSAPTTVTIKNAVSLDSSYIYFSLNNGAYSLYTGAISITAPTTVRAYAMPPNYEPSDIAIATFTQQLPVVEFIPDNAVYPIGVTMFVPGYPNAQIYYTVDGVEYRYDSLQPPLFSAATWITAVAKQDTYIDSNQSTYRATNSAKLAIVSDYGSRASTATPTVAARINEWDPDFVMSCGDNSNYVSGTPAQRISLDITPFYGDYIENDRMITALGNHDADIAGMLDAILALFNHTPISATQTYYKFTTGAVTVFVLDTRLDNTDEFDAAMQAWLIAEAAACASPWKVVLMHYSPYSSCTAHYDGMPQTRWPYKSYGIDAVISGHMHVYERLIGPDSEHYFVTGWGGYAYEGFFAPLTIPANGAETRAKYDITGQPAEYRGGYLQLTATSTRMSIAAINAAGTRVDLITLNK